MEYKAAHLTEPELEDAAEPIDESVTRVIDALSPRRDGETAQAVKVLKRWTRLAFGSMLLNVVLILMLLSRPAAPVCKAATTSAQVATLAPISTTTTAIGASSAMTPRQTPHGGHQGAGMKSTKPSAPKPKTHGGSV